MRWFIIRRPRTARRRRRRIVEKQAKLSFEDGQTATIMGRPFEIKAIEEPRNRATARLMGNTILIKLPTELSAGEKRWYTTSLSRRMITRALLPSVERRVRALNEAHFKSKINSVRLKDTATLWGSCSMYNNINLNFRLLFAPDNILDAIIIHELAHTVHRNHSKEYWSLVRSVVPDYKERRKWLKMNAHTLKPGPSDREAKLGEVF